MNELGVRFGTDKSTIHHDYLNRYERFFSAQRHQPVTVLEIGIFGGASLATWEAYFPNGKIIGADIDASCRRFAGGRVHVEILDQSNIEQLVALGCKHGPFDIIIEDGSHQWEHQITSLRTLFPFLKNGGVYVVEDLQTNYGKLAETYQGIASQTCMAYLHRLADLRVADAEIDLAQEEDAFLRTYGRSVTGVTFIKRACIIEKQIAHHSHSAPEPLVPIETGHHQVPVTISAHLGFEGDVERPAGWCKSLLPGAHIQGFALSLPFGGDIELEYRAHLANGTWSPWVRPDVFVGTRGAGQNLTGFAVRLRTGSTAAFTIKAAGSFNGLADPVIVTGGQDCVAPDSTLPLAGMQVEILRTP